MQQAIIELIDYINGLVWGLPMIILLVSAGITLSILGGFFQITKFPLAVKTMMWKGKRGTGEVHPFKIWAAVMGATVGVGNIAGASTAVHLGGPGAAFWMWICAILGMATKAGEVVLGMWSRRVLPDGRIEGGTPYYVKRVPLIGPALAVLFALFAWIAAFGIGNMVQANNVALGAEYVARAFGVETPEGIFNVRLAVGIVILIATALVVIGGLRRIAEVANYMIPFMCAWYIIFGLGLWIIFGYNFGDAIAKIFTYAFTPMAAVGGLAGWSVYNAIRYGFARGLFSNEAGLGSAPNAYAFAESDHPGRQGFYGVFEVFMDTIVVCTITMIADITTQAYIERPDLSGAALAMEAFFRGYGIWAPVIVGIALGLFAYTTLLTWEWYGEVNWRYFWVLTLKLPEKPMIWIWRFLWIVPIVPAAVAGELFETFWTFSDTANGLMAIPNLIAVIYFAPVALNLIKDFYSRHVYETGEVSKGAAPATAAVKEFVKDFIRAMYTPTYKLVSEKRT